LFIFTGYSFALVIQFAACQFNKGNSTQNASAKNNILLTNLPDTIFDRKPWGVVVNPDFVDTSPALG